MLVSIYIVFALYIAFLLLAIVNWNLKYLSPTPFSNPLSVSVIVAARNEESKINALLECLDAQVYARHLLEIVIINDHSDDKTAEIVKNFIGKSGVKIQLVNLKTISSTPKKEALKLGIKNSNHEILLFTDADCTMPITWVKEMSAPFQDPTIDLTIGCIKYDTGSFLEKMLSQEQSALLGSAAATLKMGIPTMCNGANMAIRRSIYETVHGFETKKTGASGDDELLLHKVYSLNKNGVWLVKSSSAIVSTEAATTLPQLFQQRKRWAGKWEKYLLSSTKTFAFSIFLFHLTWLTTGIYSLINTNYLMEFGIAFLLKSTLELVFIASIMNFLGKRINLLGFAILQLVYSPYVVFFGLVSRGKNYTWKGRELN